MYLTVGGGGSAGINEVGFRTASLIAIAVAMLAWFVAAIRDASWRPRSVLWPAFAIAIAAFLISTLTSWSPRLSVEYVAYAVLCAALYLLLVRLLAHPAFAQRLGALTVLLCLATGVEYVVLAVGHWIFWWIALGHLAVPPLRPGSEGLVYGNPSAVATMMLLLCPASVAYLGIATRARRLVVGVLVVLTAVVVVLTESRGAWLGLGIAAVGLVVGLITIPSARVAVRRVARDSTGRLSIGAVIVAGLAGLALLGLRRPLARPQFLRGPPVILPRRDPDVRIGAVRRFRPGNVGGSQDRVHRRLDGNRWLHPARPQHLPPDPCGVRPRGSAGGRGGGRLLGWLVYRAMTDTDPTRRRYGWATLFALLCLGGHQLVDVYANFPAVMFALALTVGVLDATSTASPLGRWTERAHGLRAAAVLRAGPVLLAVAVVGALAFSSWSESVAVTQAQAVNAANTENWDAALTLARQAATADPSMTPYQFTLGLAAAATGDLVLARDALDRAAVTSDFPEAWLDLAAVQVRLGDRASAGQSLAQAMRLGWQQAQVTVPAAALYAELGDHANAVTAVEYAFLLIPELAADPYWTSTPDLQSAATEAVDRVAAMTTSGVAYRVLLAAGRTADALRLAAAPGTDPQIARLYVHAWLGDSTALKALETDALDDPSSPAFELAEIAAERAGDQSTARRLEAIAIQGVPPAGPPKFLVGVATGCGACPQVTGAAATSWSVFTYRRPVPDDLLVLDLPRLAYH